MSGIMGYFGQYNDKKYMDNINILKHRGPDCTSIIIDNDYAFGFCRLKINDTGNIKIPFIFNDVVVMCDGVIYNYNELKKYIKNYEFKTNNDAEIILAVYLEYNRDIIKTTELLKGMFAIAIYDKLKEEGYLIRDNMGLKPLYFTKQNNLYFSSEIKSFMFIHNNIFKPNYTQLFRILCYRSSDNKNTVFDNVYKVEPANLYIINKNGEIKKHFKYWSLNSIIINNNIDIESEVNKSILLHLMSDVEISTSLSGGLDSSIITSVVSKNNKSLKTFSSFYNYKGDENEKFEKVSKYLNLENEKILIEKESFLNILDKLVWHMDEPFADPAVIPLYFITKYANEKQIKVILMGEGADEIFFGYKKYREAFSNKFTIEKYIETRSPFYIDRLRNMNLEYYKLFEIEIKDIINRYKINDLCDTEHVLKALRLWDLEMMNPNLQLMRVDKISMANSVEARVPFVYSELIKNIYGISAIKCFSEENEKLLLRNAYINYLPEDIINGKKQIFFVPLDYLIDTKTKKLMIENAKNSNIINNIITIKDKNKFYSTLNSYQIWIIYMITIWEKLFII
jgi:asparagine synthase (glutamine-hydrolysing)